MNEDQFKGTAHKLGGNVEEEFGKIVGSRDIQGEGIIDQVTGAAQELYGDAREAASTVLDRASPMVRQGAERAIALTRENTVLAVLAAGAVGYALSWAFHGSDKQRSKR